MPAPDDVTAAVAGDLVLEIRRVGYGQADALRLIEEVQQEYVVRYGGRDDTPAGARHVRPADRQLLRGLPGRRAGRLGGVAAPPGAAPTAPRTAPRSSGCTSRRPPAGTAWRGGCWPTSRPPPRPPGPRRWCSRRGPGSRRRSRCTCRRATRRSPGFGHYRDAPESRCFGKLLPADAGSGSGSRPQRPRRPSSRRAATRLVATVTARMPTTTASEASVGISGTSGQLQVAPVQRQLHADEGQDRGQAVAEVHQLAQRALEHEVERPQAEQGEGVGGEDQVGVPGDAVDRRHRVDREDDVGGQHRERRPGRAA